MCKPDGIKMKSKGTSDSVAIPTPTSDERSKQADRPVKSPRTRRGKRDKDGEYIDPIKKKKKIKKSKALQRHGKDAPSGGIESMIPSFIGGGILIFSLLAQQGFRGRASVAGIDLGTTNSVICVQAPSKSVGEIDCIKDPESGSPIIVSNKNESSIQQ